LVAWRRLFQNKYRVLSCLTYGEADRYLEREQIDVIFTDYKLNGKTGIDLLERARSMQPDCVRILISGAGVDLTLDKRRAQAWMYLDKPIASNIDIEELMAEAVDEARALKDKEDSQRIVIPACIRRAVARQCNATGLDQIGVSTLA
jgi:DNA-binding NtrC family response regulator